MPEYDSKRAFDELISKRSPQALKKTDSPIFNGLAVQSVQVGSGALVTNVTAAKKTLDFPNTGAQLSADLTIAVPGVRVGDAVAVGTPAAPDANTCYTGFVSASDIVTLRFNNYSAGAVNPAEGEFTVIVFRAQWIQA